MSVGCVSWEDVEDMLAELKRRQPGLDAGMDDDVPRHDENSLECKLWVSFTRATPAVFFYCRAVVGLPAILPMCSTSALG